MKKLLIILLLLPLCVNGQITRAYWLNGNANAQVGSNGVAKNMTWEAGALNQSGNFNGTNGYIAAPGEAGGWANTTFTISFLAKYESNSFGRILTISGTPLSSGFTITRYGGITMYGAGTSTVYFRDRGVSIGTGAWFYLTYVITTSTSDLNNNSVTIYINGEDESTTETKNAVYVSATDSISVGVSRYNQSTHYYGGNIDEVIISTGAWSAAAIKQKYLYYKGFM